MMKSKTLLAATVIAGVATMGTGATAFAQTTQPPSPSTTASRDRDFCQQWVPRLPGLDARRIQDEQKIDDLQKAIEVAKDHHREDVVERLAYQLDQVQLDHTGLVALIAVIHLRCG